MPCCAFVKQAPFGRLNGSRLPVEMGGPLDLSAPAWKVRRQAASKIQALVRVKSGAKRLLAVARSVYEVGYDAGLRRRWRCCVLSCLASLVLESCVEWSEAFHGSFL